MSEKTLADYMKEYYGSGGAEGTLSDNMLAFFEDSKISIPLDDVGAPQPD